MVKHYSLETHCHKYFTVVHIPYSSLSVLRPGGVRANSTKTVPCEVRYKVMNCIQRAQDTVNLYSIMEKIKNVLPGKFIEWDPSRFWEKRKTPYYMESLSDVTLCMYHFPPTRTAEAAARKPDTQPSAPHHTDNLKTKHQRPQAATNCIILSSSWWWA